MPRRELLTPAQRQQLLALPTDARHVAECYTFSGADLELVSAHRGEQNRLGFALQLCFLRHPGRAWTPEEQVPAPMVRFIADQVEAEPKHLTEYARRDETRREHLGELLAALGWSTFGLGEYRALSTWLLVLRCVPNGMIGTFPLHGA
jgi:TnpA family transposase